MKRTRLLAIAATGWLSAGDFWNIDEPPMRGDLARTEYSGVTHAATCNSA